MCGGCLRPKFSLQRQLSSPKRARKDSRGGYCLQFGFRSGELQGDTEEIKGALLNRGGLDRSRVRVAGISSAMVLAPALMETVVEVVSSRGLSADIVTVSFCATVIWMSTSAENPAVIWIRPSRSAERRLVPSPQSAGVDRGVKSN